MLRLTSLFLLISLNTRAIVLSADHPVVVEAEFDWYCRSKDGKYWWPGQKIDQDCYTYVCNRGLGIKRIWALEIKSHCCARYKILREVTKMFLVSLLGRV